ncbi:CaiB/BaiF CoA transferase family protein [Afipia carboxidovorans]|nr:CoA transferase [Afipia carboxidovorans]
MMKPLAGLKVLDLTRFFAGPFCTMLLGDHGADVVKVESPGGGDQTRRQGPPFKAENGMTFFAGNRNKRSLVLDAKTEEGRDLLFQLASRADVVVENFRPPVLKRLGIDYERVSAANPGVIYASLSALGPDGPQGDRGGFDITVQAEFGFMSISGEKNGKSIKQGTSVFDLVTGLYAYSGIVTALLQRKETGRGQRVETSLMESQVSFLVDAAMEYLIAGKVREKWGSEHSQIVPYKVFSTRDGEVVIGAGYQTVYEPFVRAIGREDLITDPRFATLAVRVENRDEMYRILDEEIAKYTNAEIIALLDKATVPNAPVNNVAQVFSHPQLLHRKMLLSLDHPQYGSVPTIGPAVKYSGFDVAEGWRAPPLLNEGAESVIEDWLGNSEPRKAAHAVRS